MSKKVGVKEFGFGRINLVNSVVGFLSDTRKDGGTEQMIEEPCLVVREESRVLLMIDIASEL